MSYHNSIFNKSDFDFCDINVSIQGSRAIRVEIIMWNLAISEYIFSSGLSIIQLFDQ